MATVDSRLNLYTKMSETGLFRHLVPCVQYFLYQGQYNNKLVYCLIQKVDVESHSVFTMIYCKYTLWETQNRHPPGVTIIPLISGLVKIQLTNYSRNMMFWLIGLTIGNSHSTIWNKYGYDVHIMLAFLVVLPIFQFDSTSTDRSQWDTFHEVLCQIAQRVLKLLT